MRIRVVLTAFWPCLDLLYSDRYTRLISDESDGNISTA